MAKAPADTADKAAKTPKPAKSVAPAKPSVVERMGQYFRDVRAEMTRVVWPTRPEVVNSSVVVVTTLVFFILFITLVDYVVVIPVINFISSIKIGG